MGKIPRNAGFYHPSTHAGQQRKHRDIDWRDVAKTLETGEIRQTNKEGCKMFVRDFAHTDEPIAVVANVENGHIVTVEWRYRG